MSWLIAVALGSVLAGYLYLLAFRSHAVFMVKATAALQVLLPLGMGAAAFGVTGSWLWSKHKTGPADNAVLGDSYEIGAHWRGKFGPVIGFARAGIGRSDYSGLRSFAGGSGTGVCIRCSHGTGAPSRWHASPACRCVLL
jgi:hypothetical protein